MAHSLSAKKRIRQNETRRARNRMRISALKNEIKRFLTLVQQRDTETAGQQLKTVYKQLDQVAAKGTIHPNRASRTKSRLAKRYAALAPHTTPATQPG